MEGELRRLQPSIHINLKDNVLYLVEKLGRNEKHFLLNFAIQEEDEGN